MRIFHVAGFETKVLFEPLGEMFSPKFTIDNDTLKIPLLLEDYQVKYMIKKVLNQIQEKYVSIEYFRSVVAGATKASMLPKKMTELN